MQLSTDDLLLMLGTKEAELFALRRHVAALEAAVPVAAPVAPVVPSLQEVDGTG
jgi:hypothetical protein